MYVCVCVCVCVCFARISGTRKYDWRRRPGCQGWQFSNKIDEVVSSSLLILMRAHEQLIWVFVFTVRTVSELYAPGSKKCRWVGVGGGGGGLEAADNVGERVDMTIPL